MASHNVPAYVIKVAGRWRSDAFLRYICFSVKTHELIASTIFSFKSMSFDDVRRVVPGVTAQATEPPPEESFDDPGAWVAK